MKGDIITDEDHVVRFVRRKFVDPVESGTLIQGAAFWSRPIDNNEASYNWMEHYPGDDAERVAEIKRRRRLEYKPRDLLAKLNVGEVVTRVRTEFADQDIKFIHDPLDPDAQYQLDDYSHTLMINMPAEGEPLVEAIGDVVAECVLETFVAHDVAA